MSERTVAVFFGGDSNEHEISVITGMLAVNLLRGAGYGVVPVYLPREGGMLACTRARGVDDFRTPAETRGMPVRMKGRALLAERGRKKIGYDVALNCCHGGMGEGGALSALFEWNGVPCASPGMPVSAIFMNKEYSKIAAMGLKIPVLPAFSVSETEWKRDPSAVSARVRAFGFPVVVKPSRLGSSIGIGVAREEEAFARALDAAFRLDDGALVERYLEGKRDLNCAACRLGEETRVSEVEEVFSEGNILTFAEKYEGGTARSSVLPADIPEETAERVKAYTRLLYESFHANGVVRADFLLAEDGVYFNELNTVPGSLAYYLFGDSLSEAKTFLVRLVEDALARGVGRKPTVRTGILDGGVFSGGKGCKRRKNML